jgi:sucrose-6-phosphate hydrolase SacC (GH32 family)
MHEQSKCFRLVYDITPRYVNDHCLLQDRKDCFHLFHIVGPIGKGCYDDGSEISFGHATSKDLLEWHAESDFLSIDPNSTYESDHIFAPYVCKKNDRYFLFYSGSNVKARTESMCVAYSDDLYNWTKHPHNPVFQPSRYWAEHHPFSGIWGCCRDPHVLFHPDYGYILYYVTWMKGTKGKLAALGAARSENLISWQDIGPVMIRERATEYATSSMESPCVIGRNDQFYLFYKHRDGTRLAVSDDPLNFTDKEDVWFSIAHAAEIFEVNGQWYISSCSRELLDVRHKRTDRTKGLFLACLEWIDHMPRIAPFVAV